MSVQGSPTFDGGLVQDMNKLRDVSEYCLPYNVEDTVDLDIPGGPVNLMDCRKTRISRMHSEAEKRERKLVLGRLRQRRFREKMKRLREHCDFSLQPTVETLNFN